MSKTFDNVQTGKLGIELSQEELDQVKTYDWKLYLFWQDIQDITLQNYSLRDGPERTGDGFGSGEEILERFEQRFSEEYEKNQIEYFEQIYDESEIFTSSILDSLEEGKILDALTVRKLLKATEEVTRQRFSEYKD